MRIYGAIEVKSTYDDVVNSLVDTFQKRVPSPPELTAILFLTHPQTDVSHVVYTGVDLKWPSREEFDAFLDDIRLLLPYTTGLSKVYVYDADNLYLDVVITLQGGEMDYGNS